MNLKKSHMHRMKNNYYAQNNMLIATNYLQKTGSELSWLL